MKKLALIGSNGMLAQAIKHQLPPSIDLIGLDLPDFDLSNRAQVLKVLEEAKPDVIINCAAFTDVDGCESQVDTAMRVNGDGPGYLAEAALQLDAVLVHISTDYVFDGNTTTPYTEEDAPNPQSVYGRSKLAGEKAIFSSGLERYFIIRTSWLYGPGGKNFVETMIRLSREREELRVVADQHGSPTYTEDLAQAVFTLLGLATQLTEHGSSPMNDSSQVTSHPSPITDHRSRITDDDSPPKNNLKPKTENRIYGIYHFSNTNHTTWHEFATTIIDHGRRIGMPIVTKTIVPITTAEYPLPAHRPAYSVLSKEKYQRITGAEIPTWQDGLEMYFSLRNKSCS